MFYRQGLRSALVSEGGISRVGTELRATGTDSSRHREDYPEPSSPGELIQEDRRRRRVPRCIGTIVSTSIRSLKPQEFGELVAALGDAPETVIPLHLLEQGLACAWVAGALPNPAAIFIQSYAYTRASRYPWGFGADAGALWDLLSAS